MLLAKSHTAGKETLFVTGVCGKELEKKVGGSGRQNLPHFGLISWKWGGNRQNPCTFEHFRRLEL